MDDADHEVEDQNIKKGIDRNKMPNGFYAVSAQVRDLQQQQDSCQRRHGELFMENDQLIPLFSCLC